MPNEEFERKMSFIVEQQAQFASDIQQLRESQTKTNQVVAQTGEIVAQTGEIVAQTGEIVGQTGEIVARLANATLEGFKDVNAKFDALVDAQIRTDEHLRRTDQQQRLTDEQLRRTNESVGRTDETLQGLISVVKLHFEGSPPHEA